MKLHANARLCPKSRAAARVSGSRSRAGRSAEAAEAAGVSERTASKWLARYRAEGEPGCVDRSSAPSVDPASHRTSERVAGDRRAAARCG